jgi:hypothetical protein
LVTRDAVAAYNITLFATFPLSAFACYFLVLRLTDGSMPGSLRARVRVQSVPGRRRAAGTCSPLRCSI